ncbi:MAG: histidinol-phosphate transaminase [Candidatus Omnitrophota bacterium]
MRPNILNVKNYVPGKPIEEVRRELGLNDIIKLASNENCLGPSPKAVAAIKRNLKNVNRYPDSSSFYLRKRMAKLLGVEGNNLIFGNGSDEIIGLAVRTFVKDGDEIVIAKPTFLIYEIVSQIQNAKIKLVPLTKDFRHDLKAMKEAITENTKMVFIANPDNPTGTYVTKSELNGFFKGLPEDLVVFLDEAYFEFARSACKDYPDGLGYLEKRAGLIVARSLSKAYGLAGLRIGYGISNAEVISCMEKVREPFNVNLLAQAAALAAIDDKAFLKKSLSHVELEKEFICGKLCKLNLVYVKSATNFIMVDIKKDCKLVYGKLLKKGVIVRDMKAWGWNSFIRVTVGTRDENKRFIAALKKVISNP